MIMFKKMYKKMISIPIESKIFIISMLFNVVIGVLLSYNLDLTKNFNTFFGSDTGRIFGDITSLTYDHYRTSVHPLFVIMAQPIFKIFRGIFINDFIAVIVMSSLTTSITIVYIYKILNLYNKNKNINIILCLIYLCSFSTMVFTATYETYNYAVLFLVLLWYFAIDKMKKTKITNYSYIILALLGVANFGITITNYCVYLLIVFILFLSKKFELKKLIFAVILSAILSIGLNYTQYYIWHSTTKILDTDMVKEKDDFSEKTLGIENVERVIKGDYYNSLISSDVELKTLYGYDYTNYNYRLIHLEHSIIHYIVIILFYIGTIFIVIRNFKKNILINLGLIGTLAFNSGMHLFYGNTEVFLYSQHFVYLIILLLGINLCSEKNNKIKKVEFISLIIFFIIELLSNSAIYLKIIKICKNLITNNFLIATLGFIKTAILELLIIIFVSIVIYIIIELIKYILKEKKKELKIILSIATVILVIGIQSLFVSLELIPHTNKFLWREFYVKSGEVSAPTRTDLASKKFKETFSEEIKSLNEYMEEYKQFIREYNAKTNSELLDVDFYLFGFGNRKKLLYKPGVLIDIETQEEIYKFEETKNAIVPNLYTVIIECENGDYVKIYEDEEAVHIKINDKEQVIEGTDKKIDLYEFKNQRYRNIKKVLYSEILFNIKDSKIYPNIFVYDNAWYRDAAITSMALKQTNNLDLIKDWVNNITEIYDMQNGGNKEPDNLGELLYLLSTQEDINYDLVNKIEKEAKNLAKSNENGYYIYGKTDSSDQYLYQNLWYKLGIESVGKKFKFDINAIQEDTYSRMAWWSSYKVKYNDKLLGNINYPYLSYANRHKMNYGDIVVSANYYPLSWEKYGSEADYSKIKIIDSKFEKLQISPTHTWAASELLLFLISEDVNLNI